MTDIAQEMNRFTDWYHKVNLGNGIVTPGRDFEPIWNVIESTMDRIDFRGKRVLDIGSCDGKWAFEAERRGAAEVIAVDLFDYALDRFMFCKRVLGSKARPFYNVSVYHLSDALGRLLHSGQAPGTAYDRKFDVVLFFGVLYHLRDPLLALAQIRSVVREGGLVACETAYAHAEEKSVMLFGGGDLMRLYPHVGNWWAPSLTCLREMATASLLRPVPGTETTLVQDGTMGRIGLLLEAQPWSSMSSELAYECSLHYTPPLPRV